MVNLFIFGDANSTFSNFRPGPFMVLCPCAFCRAAAKRTTSYYRTFWRACRQSPWHWRYSYSLHVHWIRQRAHQPDNRDGLYPNHFTRIWRRAV